MNRVLVGVGPFCGHCRNPFGIVQNGQPIEVGPHGRAFGHPLPTARKRALCPGFASGAHNIWRFQ